MKNFVKIEDNNNEIELDSDYDDIELPKMKRNNAIELHEELVENSKIQKEIEIKNNLCELCCSCFEKGNLIPLLCGHKFCIKHIDAQIQLLKLENAIIKCGVCRQGLNPKKQNSFECRHL